MELYRKYPKLCTVWCCVEVALYAGQLFGWASILFILKQEGFYITLCEEELFTTDVQNSSFFMHYENTTAETVTLTYNLLGDGWDIDREEGKISRSVYLDYLPPNQNKTVTQTASSRMMSVPDQVGCKEQETRLNLWFSVAVCVSYVTCSVMGHLMRALGMRKFRLLFMLFYMTGALCIGLATRDHGWLICPGLCCIGVSGMALYSSNIQLSFLFPTVQSTITSVLVGLYDFSTIIPYINKMAYEAGFSRQHFCICLCLLHLLLLGTSSFLMLPNTRIKPEKTARKSTVRSGEFMEKNEEEKFIGEKTTAGMPSLRRTLLSSEYLLHVYWMCVQGLRFVSFLGVFNTWMENKFHGNKMKENYYLGVFSYVTLGTVVTAVTAGMLHDCQRRKYMLTGEYRRKRLPVVLPLTVTSLMAVVISSLTFVEMEALLNLVFILFTIYRSYLFSYEITFLNDVYPLTSFSVLFGILHSSAGLSGMLQYPLFAWYKAYPSGPQHVNILMICLTASSLIHPFHVWYSCRKHRPEDAFKGIGTEIYI